MIRKDREIVLESKILEIIKGCEVVNVAFNDGEYPYIIPLNFGYVSENGKHILYIHSAKKGKKIDIIKTNSKASFSMYCSTRLQIEEVACKSTMKFKSVCGTGSITIVTGEEKLVGLGAIMAQYTDKAYQFNNAMLNSVEILKLEISSWSAKGNMQAENIEND